MQDKINNPIYYPMLVSQNGTGDMSREEDAHIWKTYLTLSQLKQDILTDRQMTLGMIKMQEQFNLQEQAVGQISLLIRKIFFGELSLAECEAKIGSMLTQTGSRDPNQARAIVEFIEKEILTIQPKPKTEEAQETEYEEEKPKITAINMPLLQALSKYEQLGQQVITSEKIKLKTQIEPVRPSLINWLKYYRDELGIGQHSSVERGEFLFRSDNCRKLSGEERERISLILKSVEEYLPIAIDAERQEIIFPAFTSLKPVKAEAGFAKASSFGKPSADKSAGRPSFQGVATPAFPSVAPNSQGRNTYFENPKPTPPISSATLGSPARDNAGSVSFSSGHTLPAEKEVEEKPNSFRIRPMSGGGDKR